MPSSACYLGLCEDCDNDQCWCVCHMPDHIRITHQPTPGDQPPF